MRRPFALLAAAVAAIVLSACSSDPTPAPSSSSAAGGSETAATSPSAMESSTADSSDTASSEAGSTDSSEAGSGASTAASAIALDKRTELWFSDAVRSLPARAAIRRLRTMPTSASPAQKVAAIKFYAKVGTVLTAASAALKVLPAPTVTGGDQLATSLSTAFGDAGRARRNNLPPSQRRRVPAALEKALTDARDGADADLSKATAAPGRPVLSDRPWPGPSASSHPELRNALRRLTAASRPHASGAPRPRPLR